MAEKKPTNGRRRASRQASEPAAPPVQEGPQPSIQLSEPLAVNTALTITGRNFPPRARVEVVLSHSRTPTGLRILRADPGGGVQVTIMPAAGEQSVTFIAGEVSATADFEVAG